MTQHNTGYPSLIVRPMKYAVTAIVLIVVAVLLWYLTRKAREPVVAIASSYDGPIEQYAGGKTLLVAVHARWASVWRATADALSKVDRTRYDIKLIDADADKAAVQALGVTIIPTVIVYRGGSEVARLPNMMSLGQLP